MKHDGYSIVNEALSPAKKALLVQATKGYNRARTALKNIERHSIIDNRLAKWAKRGPRPDELFDPAKVSSPTSFDYKALKDKWMKKLFKYMDVIKKLKGQQA
jgi:hypothetical protein